MNLSKYKDRGLCDELWILGKIGNENISQLDKWGFQNHTAFEWLAYLTEEIGELSQAISENEYRDGRAEFVVSEAIQVATLALKIAEMFEKEKT